MLTPVLMEDFQLMWMTSIQRLCTGVSRSHYVKDLTCITNQFKRTNVDILRENFFISGVCCRKKSAVVQTEEGIIRQQEIVGTRIQTANSTIKDSKTDYNGMNTVS